MKVRSQIVALVVWLLAGVSHAARVLALFHFPGGSHFNTLGRVVSELATRGHHVTVVSYGPLPSTAANYTHINIKGAMRLATDKLSFEHLSTAIKKDIGLLDMSIIADFASLLLRGDLIHCKAAYEHPAVQELITSIRSGQKQFDLVIVHTLMVDCFDPFAHLLGGVPLVALATSVVTPWCSDRVANPHSPAYVGNYFLSYETANMGFYDRFLNTVYQLLIKLVRHRTLYSDTEALHRRQLGPQLPPLSQSVSSTRLVLTNSHWSLSGAVPLLPNVREVGGLHIEQPQPLPQELEEFLSGSEQGAVYMSFGSLFSFHTLPLDKMRTILEALSMLDQRVLLRCDVSQLPSTVKLPSNVRASKWLPQTAVLAHRNVRVFVSHGGMHSIMEAVHFGVPLLGIPLFGDQRLNLNRMQTLGIALQQDFLQLTAQSLSSTLHSLINDTRYRERTKELSVIFRDRPRPPLEEAVYWVEYVIRHQGAPHLRSAALDLAWYQYLLLDVAAVVGFCVVLMVTMLYLCLRTAYLMLGSKVVKCKVA